MRTFCPHCQTTFRITPDQLKARAGKVRCGQCQTVFNALDCLLDETNPSPGGIPATAEPVSPVISTPTAQANIVSNEPQRYRAPEPISGPAFPPTGMLDFPSSYPSDSATEQDETGESMPPTTPAPDWPTLPSQEEFPPPLATPFQTSERTPDPLPQSYFAETRLEPRLEAPPAPEEIKAIRDSQNGEEVGQGESNGSLLSGDAIARAEDVAEDPPINESRLRELGKTSGLILPRDTTEIPGYSRWAEDVVSSPIALPDEKPTRWPFVLVAMILALVLAGQVVFFYRSEIATMAPSTRPLLQLFSEALHSNLPLPRHVERVSIEASDLQSDRTRNNLLLLTATLRNRARYEQAYPSLELALTDTGDTAIVRRVFHPADYLPPAALANQPFAASSDIAVRLWIEAKDITAAGYRLYVFYP